MTVDAAAALSHSASLPDCGTEGFKKTDLGPIPSDWDVVPLSKVGESLIGLTYSPSDESSDGTLVLRSSNIQAGRLCFDDNVFVQMDVPERVLVKSGDILICVRNGSRELIGKCAYIDPSAEGMAFGAFMGVFRSEFNAFLFPVFESELFRRQVREHLGATINQITNKSLNGFLVPLPSTEKERHAIAGALSDTDALIESLESLIAKKRAVKLGAMQQLLSGQRRLWPFAASTCVTTAIGELPGDWRVVAIGDVAGVKTGPFGSALHRQDYVSDGTPIITVEHLGEMGILHENLPMVSDDDRKRLNAYALETGDIVFSRVGSIDRNGMVTDAEAGWLFSGRLLRLRPSPDQVDYRYLSYHFCSMPFKDRIRAVAVGQTMASLNTRILEGVLIALPPRKEQEAMADLFCSIDSDIVQLERQLSKIRQVKRGMMQELLTGKVRLI